MIERAEGATARQLVELRSTRECEMGVALGLEFGRFDTGFWLSLVLSPKGIAITEAQGCAPALPWVGFVEGLTTLRRVASCGVPG